MKKENTLSVLKDIRNILLNKEGNPNGCGSFIVSIGRGGNGGNGKAPKWGKTSDKRMTWDEAVKWCKEQGGRLPTSVELHQAFLDKVEGFQPGYYWSGTEVPSGPTSAYFVLFDIGFVGYYAKGGGFYVRCVR